MLRLRKVCGRVHDKEMVSIQNIQLIPRLAGLKLTLLPVLVDFVTMVSLPLGPCQHYDLFIRQCLRVNPALLKMPVLLAAASNALERSLA